MGPVKDQASCGSCWAFATAGAVEGAYYVARRETLSLSEQNLVDCAWDFDHQVRQKMVKKIVFYTRMYSK